MKKAWLDLFSVTLGSFIIAAAFNLFLLDFHIAFGGVGGISVLTEEAFGWRPAYTQGVLNLLILLSGFLTLGKRFGMKSVYGSFVLPLFVYLTEGLPEVTSEPFLAAVFGGVGAGLGLGVVFRSRASTGGTDLVAQIIHRFTGLSLGFGVFLIDAAIVLTAGFVFGPETALISLMTLFIVGRTIDAVQVGWRSARISLILTKRERAVKEMILYKLDRGVTVVPAFGGYTAKERSILLCVIHSREISKLKDLIRPIDPDAFVIVAEASDVLGEGFKRI